MIVNSNKDLYVRTFFRSKSDFHILDDILVELTSEKKPLFSNILTKFGACSRSKLFEIGKRVGLNYKNSKMRTLHETFTEFDICLKENEFHLNEQVYDKIEISNDIFKNTYELQIDSHLNLFFFGGVLHGLLKLYSVSYLDFTLEENLSRITIHKRTSLQL